MTDTEIKNLVPAVQIIPDQLINILPDGSRLYSGSVEWEDNDGKKWKSTRYMTLPPSETGSYIEKIKKNFIELFK